MNIKKIVLSGLIIILVGISLFFIMNGGDINLGSKEPKCKMPINKNECLALALRDSNYCYNITAKEDVNQCLWWYNLLEVIDKNDDCNRFSEDQKQICLAIINKNKDYCKKVNDEKFANKCELVSMDFFDSVKTKKTGVCDKMHDKDRCKAMMLRDKQLCDVYDTIDPMQCLEIVKE